MTTINKTKNNKAMDFKEIIQQYLENLASSDETFAAKYANENKSIDKCIKYIMNKVAEMRKKNEGCLAVKDDEVFGMAVHYYDEEDIEVDEPAVKVEVMAATPEAPKKKRTCKKKSEAQIVDLDGLSVSVNDDDTDVEFPMF